VQERDLPAFAELMQSDWLDLVAREGTAAPTPLYAEPADPEAEPPCPACGTAAPLVDGACSDCGLQLA
jgi:hypothetical protein